MSWNRIRGCRPVWTIYPRVTCTRGYPKGWGELPLESYPFQRRPSRVNPTVKREKKRANTPVTKTPPLTGARPRAPGRIRDPTCIAVYMNDESSCVPPGWLPTYHGARSELAFVSCRPSAPILRHGPVRAAYSTYRTCKQTTLVDRLVNRAILNVCTCIGAQPGG